MTHAAVKYSMRGQGRGPRGQRALDAEGGRRRATADRRIRMLLTTVFYGMQESSTLPFPTTMLLADGIGDRREGLGRRGRRHINKNATVL
jgi:hypothetical protein